MSRNSSKECRRWLTRGSLANVKRSGRGKSFGSTSLRCSQFIPFFLVVFRIFPIEVNMTRIKLIIFTRCEIYFFAFTATSRWLMWQFRWSFPHSSAFKLYNMSTRHNNSIWLPSSHLEEFYVCNSSIHLTHIRLEVDENVARWKGGEGWIGGTFDIFYHRYNLHLSWSC